jgi:hypothetical protein
MPQSQGGWWKAAKGSAGGLFSQEKVFNGLSTIIAVVKLQRSVP